MKILKLVQLTAVAFLLMAAPAFAQQPAGTPATPAVTTPNTVVLSGAGLGAGLGMALTIIGAGYGMGKIGSAALESMARQPEVAPRIQTAMIIIAAMLEGATLASVILCYLIGGAARF